MSGVEKKNMGSYVVTGGSGGIGAEIVRLLKEHGNEVINVDIKNGDIEGNLASPDGRKEIVEEIKRRCPDGLDGLVCNAGVNAACGNPGLIISLNYFGSTVIATELWPLLGKKSGSIVITSSNSIIQGKGVDIAHLLAGGVEEKVVLKIVSEYDKNNFSKLHELYVASKYAQALWTRRMAATSAARGVRVNGVAPGNIRTPMTMGAGAGMMDSLNALPAPTKYGGDSLQEPEEIAKVICFLLSRDSLGINGNIVFADGGTDALLRPDRVC